VSHFAKEDTLRRSTAMNFYPHPGYRSIQGRQLAAFACDWMLLSPGAIFFTFLVTVVLREMEKIEYFHFTFLTIDLLSRDSDPEFAQEP
jgi:hypothetical protein